MINRILENLNDNWQDAEAIKVAQNTCDTNLWNLSLHDNITPKFRPYSRTQEDHNNQKKNLIRLKRQLADLQKNLKNKVSKFCQKGCEMDGLIATAENMAFKENLGEFSRRVGIIVSLEINGKVSQTEAYGKIKNLWKQLKKSKKGLNVGKKEAN